MSRDSTHTSPGEEVSRALHALQDWPWLETVKVLRQRFREDRLGLTASSLTFTTIMALVPLVTVALALFSAFPMFGRFQDALQRYFLQSLVPASIAQPVLQGLTSFAEQATKVGTLGFAFLVVTALALMATIDRALNNIWRVRRMRSFGRRVLIYWGVTTLLPLVFGVALSVASLAVSASRDLVGGTPGGVRLLFDTLAFAMLAAAMSAMYHFIPNTHVRWRHAIAGGLFVAIAFEIAKRALAWYLLRVPGYSLVYGAFATVPIFLLWTYMSWLIVLFGAVIAAYAPSLQSRMRTLQDVPGARFGLAVAMLRELIAARERPGHGLSAEELWEGLRIDPLQVEPLLDALVDLDWAGRLDEDGSPRYVLLCDPAATPARPLLAQLLLEASPAIQGFWRRADFDALTLADVVAP
ncbi:MAG TPA: YihY family inner membrane protein [Burkholderiaceae bacterium]|jgi:membrane protein|nr:YihY family inner membrane protein [Burkholderiaceae bacterium]